MWIASARYPSCFSAELVGDSTAWWVDADLYARNVEPGEIDASDASRAIRMTAVDDVIRVLGTRRALRDILGQALERAPSSLQFGATKGGKPTLLDGLLCFSISRSGPEALIGLNRTREIGVDIETVRELTHLHDLSEAVLTDSERQSLARIPKGDASRKFLIAWTRKEACLKALGTGLKMAPRGMNVGCDWDTRQIVVDDDSVRRVLSVQSFPSPRNAVCALACVIG